MNIKIKEEREYSLFKLKMLDKIKDINETFNNLSENNKTRFLFDLKKVLPNAIFSFELELNKRK